MVLLTRDEVPAFLRTGLFFNSLDADDDETFEVPDHCFKRNTNIANIGDLRVMLESLNFWGVNHLPIEAASCLYLDRYLCRQLMKKFPEFKDVLQRIEREPPGNITISKAIRFGCGVDAVKSIHQRGYRLCAEDSVAAATLDDLESLMYLRERCCPWTSNVISAAVKCGSVSCLQYALDSGCPCDFDKIGQAVLSGQVESVKCLLRNGERITPALAARTWKHVDMLLFMNKQGLHTPGLTCRLCAEQNRVDVLEYLHNQGCFWDKATCATAGREGSLDCLMYLHTHGCPWDDRTTTNAARHGHLECLRYAVENGCPVTVEPFEVLEMNQYDCSIYLVQRNYEVDEFCWAVFTNAVNTLLQLCIHFAVVLPGIHLYSCVMFCGLSVVLVLLVAFKLLGHAMMLPVPVISCDSQYLPDFCAATLKAVLHVVKRLVTSVLHAVGYFVVALRSCMLELVRGVTFPVRTGLNLGARVCKYFVCCAAPVLRPVLLLVLRTAKAVRDYEKSEDV